MKPYYQHAGVTIYHGDCCEIVPQLTKVELVVTDPPYAIGATRGEWSVTASVAIGLRESSKRVVRTGSLVTFTTTSGRGIEFTQGAIAKHLPFNRLLTWQKRGGRSRAVSPWRWDTAAVMVFGRAPSLMVGESSVCLSGGKDEDSDYEEHPSPLPAEVCDWVCAPFRLSDQATALALDPFMGTGALLASARRVGYSVVGVEKDERYCELAAKRFALPVQAPHDADLGTYMLRGV